jgi:predicted metal-dependent phosphoesterase TrpH
MSADELIQESMRRELDAVVVTDHLYAWGGRAAQALGRDTYNFPVLRGVEARTTLGDVLVFGLDEDFPEGIDGAELLGHVEACGGASVLAHPFRHGGGWALWYWLEKQGLQLDGALAARPEFVQLHAVETFNGHVSSDELAQAEDLARILGLPAAGGSDAHAPHMIGNMVTEFVRPIWDETDLVREIRAGRIRPRRIR